MTKKQNDELKIIRALLSGKVKDLKLRGTAEWLNESLPKPFQRSHMTISNWIDGIYKPDDVVLIGMRTYYPEGDPRHEAAVQIMDLRGTSKPWISINAQEGKKLLGVVKMHVVDDVVVHTDGGEG